MVQDAIITERDSGRGRGLHRQKEKGTQQNVSEEQRRERTKKELREREKRARGGKEGVGEGDGK